MEEEGPRRGFSLVGWKEKRPRKEATQEEECWGQLLTDIVMIKSIMLAAVIRGTSQGEWLLFLYAHGGLALGLGVTAGERPGGGGGVGTVIWSSPVAPVP